MPCRIFSAVRATVHGATGQKGRRCDGAYNEASSTVTTDHNTAVAWQQSLMHSVGRYHAPPGV